MATEKAIFTLVTLGYSGSNGMYHVDEIRGRLHVQLPAFDVRPGNWLSEDEATILLTFAEVIVRPHRPRE